MSMNVSGQEKGLRSGTLLLVGSAIAVIGGVVWWFSGGSDSKAESKARELRSRKVVSTASDRKARSDRGRRQRAQAGKSSERRVPVKPDFISDLEADRKLTAEMRKIFFELQAALDLEDAKKVYALVHKLQLMDEWPDGIPREVKLKALQALSWFGASGMAEAVGFLGDSDPEIRQEALSEFEEMLSDWDLGDRGISDILKQVVTVVHDHDALDAFFMELNNMRPTVKAETALAIFDSRNADAISVLEENLGFAFESDVEVRTREDVEQYLADAEQAYKDDPELAATDEEFYGPFKK